MTEYWTSECCLPINLGMLGGNACKQTGQGLTGSLTYDIQFFSIISSWLTYRITVIIFFYVKKRVKNEEKELYHHQPSESSSSKHSRDWNSHLRASTLFIIKIFLLPSIALWNEVRRRAICPK